MRADPLKIPKGESANHVGYHPCLYRCPDLQVGEVTTVVIIRGESLSYWGYSRAIKVFPLSGGADVWAKPHLPSEAVHSRVPPAKYKLFILTIVLSSNMPLVGMWEVVIGPLMDLLYNKLFNITW